MSTMTSVFRGRIKPINGHWWGLIDNAEGINTWVPLGSVEKVKTKDLIGRLRLCRFYFMAGIISKLTGPVIREDGEEVIEIIKEEGARE